MSQKLLQELDDRYTGTKMYEVQKNIAVDATGIAYTGMWLLHIPQPLTYTSV